MDNWYRMLQEIMESDKKDFSQKKCTLTDKELKVNFDSGYGGSEGIPFTAWGKKWVYFPIVYDDSEWIGHAPRFPCKISMSHQGGE